MKIKLNPYTDRFEIEATDKDLEFIREGLFKVKADKADALRTLELVIPQAKFTEQDFGIPHIDNMIDQIEEVCS